MISWGWVTEPYEASMMNCIFKAHPVILIRIGTLVNFWTMNTSKLCFLTMLAFTNGLLTRSLGPFNSNLKISFLDLIFYPKGLLQIQISSFISRLEYCLAKILIKVISMGSIFIFDQIFCPLLQTTTVAYWDRINFTKALDIISCHLSTWLPNPRLPRGYKPLCLL